MLAAKNNPCANCPRKGYGTSQKVNSILTMQPFKGDDPQHHKTAPDQAPEEAKKSKNP